MSNKREILKTINGYDMGEIGVNEIYNKAERELENGLISLQDNSMIYGFICALRLVRETPMEEVDELIDSILKADDNFGE
jgi:hypothetical protein